MDLKGSQTEKNLMAAFAGESQARNRYTYYAKKARKDGYQQIADIFAETADQEMQHASSLFKKMTGGETKITAAFPFGVTGDTTDNLAAAMRGSLEHDQAEIALRLGGALKWWLFTRPQFGQYAIWLKRALQDNDDAAPRYRAKALHAVNLGSFLPFRYDRFDEASAGLAEKELDAAEKGSGP